MKKILLLVSLFITSYCYSQVQNVTFSIEPAAFNEDDEITITVSNFNPSAAWGVSDIYLWAWSLDKNDLNSIDSPTNGTWNNSNEVQKFTNNGDGTFSYKLTPTTFYNRTNIGSIGFLIKAKDGAGDKKSQDNIVKVGSFQLSLTNPTQNLTILSSGASLTIEATTTLASDFILKANGATLNTSTNTTTFSFIHTNITENTTYSLEATNTGETKSESFQVIVSIPEQPVPTGMKDGINLNPTDATKATLVLFAPNKNIVHLLGDFNNWEIDNNYLLNKDTANNRFWIELTGLTPQTNHMYQYLVDGAIKIADPYSTTILAESNDQYINAITYPNLPAYPAGLTNHAVTLLRTGDPDFNWTANTYTPPAKENLIIYELLIRDFDQLHSFDAVKARLDYLQGLGINAIELMPVSEFDGNESWGYNPSFHMALDKYYGTPTAFKQFIDECHKRGIAIILDVVYNHASGQNPFYRLWNTDNGGYGGQASPDSPFFNPVATHTYSVFNDLNHSKQATQDYVKRTTQYWIDEYKIDGFRWDLTKGFTQNCTSTDESCTGAYQQDRVDVLKKYADFQWESNADFYVIFEHLGGNTEETQWANYGIMLWGNTNNNYNQNTMGYSNDSDISRVSHKSRSWNTPSLVGYMESHDEERLMYKNLEFGNSTNPVHDVKDLNTALSRQETAGLFFLTIPGPKMIWQFGELGYDYSINSCPNGAISNDCRVSNKPIRWDYDTNPNRKHIYNTWATLAAFKTKYPEVFNTTDFTLNVGNTSTKSIILKGNSFDVVILGNFDIVDKSISTTFTKTGTWYEYFSSEEKNISSTSQSVSLKPGEYKMYTSIKLLDPRGGTATDDSDNDGVVDTEDLCPNTMKGVAVSNTGCPIFTLPSNNFKIETIGETCPTKDNGKLKITAVESLNYKTTINGTLYTFTNTLTIEKLAPKTYDFCILVEGQTYQQCYAVTIEAGKTIGGKASITSNKVAIDITQGTAPFNVLVNGEAIFETMNSSFSVDVLQGDLIQVKTSVDCEGVFSKQIDLVEKITAYPNPTKGFFEITVPYTKKEVNIELYNMQSQLISSKWYSVTNGKVQLNIENMPKGLYLVRVITNNPFTLKIIKQ